MKETRMRGQAAAEYLVLLAIVLIVSLIGIVLLGGFSEGAASSMDASSRSYWSGQARPFAINEWVRANDVIYMEIENRELQRLVLTNISFDGAMQNLSGGGWVFGPSSKKNLSLGGLITCNITSYDYYDYDIIIYYDSEQISNKVQAGAKSLAGTCAFS